jgi:hypothetical protein
MRLAMSATLSCLALRLAALARCWAADTLPT